MVGRKLLRAFRVAGYEKGHSHKTYKAFTQGIYDDASDDDADATDWHRASMRKSVLNTTRSGNSTRVQNFFPQTKSGRDTIKISSKSSQVTTHMKPTFPRNLETSQESDADIQDLVDAQLADMGAPFGVTIEPLSPSPKMSKSRLDRFRTTPSTVKAGSDSSRKSIRYKEMKVKNFIIEETISEVKEEITNSEIADKLLAQRLLKRASPELDVDLFTKELLENATIPTPTPPP